MNVKVPHLAEGINAGTVVNVLVKEGEQVKKEQILFELETEKAVAPIPAPENGTISKINIKPGDVVSVGQPVMTLTEAGGSQTGSAKDEQVPTPKQAVSQSPAQPVPVSSPSLGHAYQYESKSGFPPPASPTIRKMAAELGIDLTRIHGSEAGGRIVIADLRNYILHLQQGAGVSGVSTPAPVAAHKIAPSETIDFSKWGPVTKKPISTLRKKIAQKMSESWTAIPHVTQFDEADITFLMDVRKKYSSTYEQKGARLTLTGIIVKLMVDLLKKYPPFNSSLDEAAQEIVQKQYYNIGVAVDTEQGLIVPVLKNADQKGLFQISKELQELAEKTRQRKVAIEDLQGGTFTISNLGSIGGTLFTPIVNKPEVAILGLGRGIVKPVVKDGKIQSRLILPVSLSYDHRVIDGADGARFIKELVHALEDFEEVDLKMEEDGAKSSNAKTKKLVSARGKK